MTLAESSNHVVVRYAAREQKRRDSNEPNSSETDSFESVWSDILKMELSPAFTINMLEKLLAFTLSQLHLRVKAYTDDALEIVTESGEDFSLADKLRVSAMP